jgi:hypothetical protein
MTPHQIARLDVRRTQLHHAHGIPIHLGAFHLGLFKLG